MAFTMDELIREALTEIRLQNQYFSPESPGQEERLEDARKQYASARREIIVRSPAIWTLKKRTLSQDRDLPDGWYRLPADYINLESPKYPIDSDVMEDGTVIVQLSTPVIKYHSDRPEEGLSPLFQKAVRYCFLSKLMLSEDSAVINQTAILLKAQESFREWNSYCVQKKDKILSSQRGKKRFF